MHALFWLISRLRSQYGALSSYDPNQLFISCKSRGKGDLAFPAWRSIWIRSHVYTQPSAISCISQESYKTQQLVLNNTTDRYIQLLYWVLQVKRHIFYISWDIGLKPPLWQGNSHQQASDTFSHKMTTKQSNNNCGNWQTTRHLHVGSKCDFWHRTSDMSRLLWLICTKGALFF